MDFDYMAGSKRKPKPISDPDFLSESEMDDFLMNVCGISRKELEQDLLKEAAIVKISHGQIQVGGTQVKLYAEPDAPKDAEEVEIIDWLTDQSILPVCAAWENEHNRQVISSLLRCPGGFHEWLMVAAMPMFKEMGIPLALIRDTRMKISECRFAYLDPDSGQLIRGRHGDVGSGHMHKRLLTYYTQAYNEWQERSDSGDLVMAGPIIAEKLQEFCGEFFVGDTPIPGSLLSLIQELSEGGLE